jgi:sugar fermentation stimulation protein A
MLHTHLTNAVAHYLLTHREVPGLEGAIVRASEVKVGRNRFDFLLEQGKKRILLEVKSCTLFGRHVAMFPDAVTERGARHLRELASRAEGNTDGAVLFVVHWPHARIFMPNYHTDLCFAETLLAVRHQIRIIALSVRWGPDLSLEGEPRLLDIPWDYIERESKDRGSYLLVLFLKRNRSVSVGKLGKVLFARGFYVYVGSAMGGLKRRIERHRRLRKHLYWHIDALRAVAEFRYALPVRSSVRLECDIASALESLGDWQIPGFGSTDCTCRTHLFGFTSDPVDYPGFHNLLQHFRMDRYVSTS